MQMKDKIIAIEDLIQEDVVSFGKRHHYCSEFTNLFSNQKTSLTSTRGSFYKKDKRSLEEYYKNIGLGWIIEDFLVDMSNHLFSLNGCDAQRHFLTYNITNDGDLIDKNNTIYEVVCDFTGLKHKSINLRDEKLMHLRKQNAKIIIVDILNKKFLIKKAKDFAFFKIPHFKPYGNKPAYRIYLNEAINYFESF